MDEDVRALVQELHASRAMAVVAVAGAGARALTWLLSVPGASRTLLEAIVPYSPGSLAEYLGAEPAQYVSAQTAEAMASAAYRRAVALRPDGVPVVGVGCTAAIVSDRPKRGEHRCYVATWHAAGRTTYGLRLGKGLRTREGEDKVVSRLVVRALAEACQLGHTLAIELHGDEQVSVSGVAFDDPLKAALAQHVRLVVVPPDGEARVDERVRGGVLPGSFNPLHEGHERLARVASEVLGADVTFEVSITNVDKPPLEEGELRRRLAQFSGRWPVAVTSAPVFHEKAVLFPGCTFVVGWDTAARLVEPRYYDGDEIAMMVALSRLRDLSCRFLVAGRLEGGVFRTLDNLPLPAGVRGMFSQLPESAFRCDLSSTELRIAAGRG